MDNTLRKFSFAWYVRRRAHSVVRFTRGGFIREAHSTLEFHGEEFKLRKGHLVTVFPLLEVDEFRAAEADSFVTSERR